MTTVAFRADASAAMGAGHIARTATLARELKRRGSKTILVTARGSLRFFPDAGDAFTDIYELLHPGASAAEISHGSWLSVPVAVDATATATALSEPVDLVVVDHYGLRLEWEQQIRRVCRRIAVISDAPGASHDCDVLLDQNILDGSVYNPFVPTGATILAGPRYAILRPEFATALAERTSRRSEIRNVLISFGGVDPANITSNALDALSGFGLEGTVVIGAQHPHRRDIEQRCNRQGFACHVQTSNIAKLIASSDLAIGASGASAWERCFLGLPSIVVTLADNQAPIAQALADAGAAIWVGGPDADVAARIATAIAELRDAPGRLTRMESAAFAMIGDHTDFADELARLVG